MLEWNQVRGITSVLVGVGHDEVAKDDCGMTEGVLATTDVGVSAVEKEMSSAAEGVMKLDELVLRQWWSQIWFEVRLASSEG